MCSADINPKVHSYSSLKESFPKALEYGIKEFTCSQEPEIVSFLNERVASFEDKYMCRTYLIIDENTITEDKLDIIAYFSISLLALELAPELSHKKRSDLVKNSPNSESLKAVPGYLIAQLGRNDEYRSNVYSGKDILNSCLGVIERIQDLIGITLVIVECKKILFDKFYSKNGFKSLYPTNTVGYETMFAYEKFKV